MSLHIPAEYSVNIAGWNKLFDRKTSFIRRLYWTVAIVGGLILTTSQGLDRVLLYFSNPISVNVQIITNLTIQLPAITICPFFSKYFQEMAPSKVTELFEKMYQNSSYPGFNEALMQIMEEKDIREVQSETAYNITSLMRRCYHGRGKTCAERGKFWNSNTLLGQCLTYQGEPAQLAGPYHGLYISLNFSTETIGNDNESHVSWMIGIDGAWVNPSLKMRTHGVYVGKNWNKLINVFYSRKSSLITDENKCVDAPLGYSSNCVIDCFSKHFINKMGCRLSYMTGRSPFCKGYNTYKDAHDYEYAMLVKGAWSIRSCNCPNTCKDVTFSYRGDTTEDRTDNLSRLKLFYSDLNFQEIREVYNYNFISLVADLGGVLGLLLGASLLTLIEIFEFIYFSVTKFLNENRAKQKIETKVYVISPKN